MSNTKPAMINYSIIDSSHIAYATYSGDIPLHEVEEFYMDLIRRPDLPKNLRILQDEREARFLDTEKTIDRIVLLLPKLVERFTTLRIAIWQVKPLETAYSKLFIGQIKTKNVAVTVFYTKEAALSWL